MCVCRRGAARERRASFQGAVEALREPPVQGSRSATTRGLQREAAERPVQDPARARWGEAASEAVCPPPPSKLLGKRSVRSMREAECVASDPSMPTQPTRCRPEALAHSAARAWAILLLYAHISVSPSRRPSPCPAHKAVLTGSRLALHGASPRLHSELLLQLGDCLLEPAAR